MDSDSARAQGRPYTISGEWEYEELRLPEGAIAYAPVESVHTPSSEELVAAQMQEDGR